MPQLQGVDLRPAAAIVQVHLQNILAFDQKAHDPALPLFESHTGQTAAVAQKDSAFKNIRGLKPLGLHQGSPPFCLIYLGRYDRKEKRFKGLLPFGAVPNPPTATGQSHGLVAFLSC
ncbi:MAG: hypothetical protein WAU91_08135 [Desulfatitalea sp.]